MQIAYIALVVLYVFICFFLILVVLLQQGKGADIAGAFGGGGTQTAFGARGATTLLHKLTTGAFVGFIVLALLLTILEARPRSSVIGDLPAGQTAPAKPAAQKPAAQPPASLRPLRPRRLRLPRRPLPPSPLRPRRKAPRSRPRLPLPVATPWLLLGARRSPSGVILVPRAVVVELVDTYV